MLQDESSLESFADKLLMQTGARHGEYPAYSERELRLRRFAHGEKLQCELSSRDQTDCEPIAWGETRRIRRGFRALARRVFRMTALSRRQRSVVRLVLSGRSLRGAAGLIGMSKTSVERAVEEAVVKMRRTVSERKLEDRAYCMHAIRAVGAQSTSRQTATI